MSGPPRIGSSDVLVWTPTPDGTFYVRLVLHGLLEQWDQVPWHWLVWFGYEVPTHSFILRLAVREQLYSLDRVNLFLSFPNRCFLCRADFERHNHLLFECSYSMQMVSFFQLSKKFAWPWRWWDMGVLWAATRWKGKNSWHVANRLVLQAMVYFLWCEHNNWCWHDSERFAN